MKKSLVYRDIREALEITRSILPDYAKTLDGPRTRGSQTEHGIENMIGGFHADLLDDQSLAGPGTAIYQGVNPGLGIMTVEAMELHHAIEMGADVRVRNGAHGAELYFHTPFDEVKTKTNVITFIIATADNAEVPEGALITWYPGPVMAHLSKRTAVKHQ